MKSKHLIIGITTMVLFGAVAYCYARTNPNQETPDTTNEIKPTVSGKKDKILVAYFGVPETDGVDAVAGASRAIVDGELFGNTEYIAKVIQEATGGDLFIIKTAHQYPGTHKELIDFAKKEIDTKARPKLSTHINNLNEYDVIFIGFPNWWYDMPMPIYTFFEEYDFSGKTIIPFCTHGGSRFSDALKTIADLEKEATVIRGLPISRDNIAEAKPSVLTWLQTIGMIN